MAEHESDQRNRQKPDLDVLEESALAQAQATIQRAMNKAEISKAELARELSRPRSFVSRMLSGNHNLTVRTMARSLSACGYEVEFGLVPIQWGWIEQSRAVDLQEVPVLEGTLLPAMGTSLAAGCPSV